MWCVTMNKFKKLPAVASLLCSVYLSSKTWGAFRLENSALLLMTPGCLSLLIQCFPNAWQRFCVCYIWTHPLARCDRSDCDWLRGRVMCHGKPIRITSIASSPGVRSGVANTETLASVWKALSNWMSRDKQPGVVRSPALFSNLNAPWVLDEK